MWRVGKIQKQPKDRLLLIFRFYKSRYVRLPPFDFTQGRLGHNDSSNDSKERLSTPRPPPRCFDRGRPAPPNRGRVLYATIDILARLW